MPTIRFPELDRTRAVRDWTGRTYYGAGRYSFTAPTKDRNYVKIMQTISFLEGFGGRPTLAEIKSAMREPPWRGWGSAKYAALAQAGLISHKRVYGNRVVYHVTGRGRQFLAALDASCA